MWIEELDNGKFKYCERYTDVQGKIRKVTVTLEKNSTRAQNEAARLLYNKIEAKKEKQALENDTSSITFWEVQERFLEVTKDTIKVRSNASRENAKIKIREYIKKDTLIRDITSTLIIDILEDLYYKKNYSFIYISIVKAQFNMVLDYAISKEYIDTNPVQKVKIKRKIETLEQRENKKNKYLEKKELKDVIKQMQIINKSTALLIEFMALTGIRCGECLAIQVKNIQGNTLQINGSWDIYTRSKTTPKNIYSDRKISLTKRCLEIINEKMEINKKKLPNYKGVPDDFIFITAKGKPESVGAINERLKKVKSDKKITTHIFRHSHIALLTELGIPLKAIMERVGHSNPQTTLAIYSHVTEKMSKNIVEKLEKVNLK